MGDVNPSTPLPSAPDDISQPRTDPPRKEKHTLEQQNREKRRRPLPKIPDVLESGPRPVASSDITRVPFRPGRYSVLASPQADFIPIRNSQPSRSRDNVFLPVAASFFSLGLPRLPSEEEMSSSSPRFQLGMKVSQPSATAEGHFLGNLDL